jgi:CBS domain containing-hemolysin-like protein
MTLLIASVTIVILTSATCSLFEAVLYSVPVAHVETLAGRGRTTGRVLRRLRRNVDRPIAAILSLNTIANTAGAAVAGAAAAQVLGLKALPWFSAAFTLAILIFSEVMPKTAGVVHSRRLAGLIALPLQGLVWIMAPLIALCRLATAAIGRGQASPAVSDEELVVMARLGLQSGSIEEDEARVIQNILALEKKRARDVMTPRTVVFSLPAGLSAAKARAEAGLLVHSRWPIYERNTDDIVGIVHRRHVLSALADGRDEVKLDSMMKPAHFVPELMPLDRLLRFFLERREHLAVVIDEHGGVAGVVTLEDVLEEILGEEIMDESDQVADLRELARRRRKDLLK